MNAPRQIRCVRASDLANVGERMQDKATKLDSMNVWTLCTDQCCELRRLVWPVQSEEVGRERSESARNARNPFGVQGK
jgi:hypothetical protein